MKVKNAVLSITLVAVVSLLAAACGPSKVPVQVAPEQPAARADLRVGADSNDNTTIDLRVRHLADPARLSPPRSIYMVWLRPQGGETTEPLGQLQVDKNLDGRLRAVTPYREFELLVSAEDDIEAFSPSHQIALRTSVNR
jgi:hypothetical protein